MIPARRRALVAVGLMAASFAGAAAWKPRLHLADQRAKLSLEAVFPKAFDDWRVDDRIPVQLVSPDTQAMLDKIYNQTLSRTYVNAKGERIMLSVAYGGDQSDATRAHRPEVCYPAQGFQLISQYRSTLDIDRRSLPVRRLVARMGARNEPITYWVTVGDRTAVSGTEQKLAQLWYGTRGVVPDGMLVRVSSIDPDPVRAHELQASFVGAMARAIDPGLSDRVFGGVLSAAPQLPRT